MAVTFMHVGITVSDMDKMVDFYSKYFGMVKEREITFGADFISDSPLLYRQEEGVYSDMAMVELKAEPGVTLELFRFSNVEAGGTSEWHKTGYHHIAFQMDNMLEICEQLKADGIELFFEPKERGPKGSGVHWVFFKDPDGNMIELWD